jgi:hypothetical protein
MTRCPVLLLAAAFLPSPAEALPRSFTVGSFDRVKIEGPYAVALATGVAPFARAEGSAAALDAIDLRVEGRTLVVRQRRGEALSSNGGERVTLALGSPDVRSVSLVGSGSLSVDRLKGLSVEVLVAGPGSLSVQAVEADRLAAAVRGSGSLTLKGRVKNAMLVAQGTPMLSAEQLASNDASISSEGAGEVQAQVTGRATVTAAGTMVIRLSGRPACILRTSGSAVVEGCATAR